MLAVGRRRLPGARDRDLRIEGWVAPGFEPVAEEFERNFTERGELGAACAAFVDGTQIVDLWGGMRDRRTRAPWRQDTMVMVFSTTKGLSAMALAVAHSSGLLDYDEPVARYWPEFAQNGKATITVRQLLAHQAGLSAVDERLTLRKLADLDGLAAALARQRPAWEPGTRHGYHAESLGWYEGELLRRVDPRHRSLGRYFADEVARPLGAEFYIGLPMQVPNARLAVLSVSRPRGILSEARGTPDGLLRAIMNPRSLTARAYFNPRMSLTGEPNRREYLLVESPASNGVGQARAIARAYGSFATGARELGISPGTLKALEEPPVAPTGGSRDLVTLDESAYSLGFSKPSPSMPFGTSGRAFGAAGLGGSFGFADPDAGLGFAYAPNHLRLTGSGPDPRELALRRALYACLPC